ncbi:MAG: hypothetical protein ACREOW_13425 [Thermodesulfobacteriota bacterium]
MYLSFLFILISFFFGFTVTLFFKDEFLFEERIFYGALIGFVSSTWIGFIEALIFGLDLKTIVFTSAVLILLTFLILYIFLFKKYIGFSSAGIFHSEVLFPILTLCCIFSPVFYTLFSRVILWKEDGLYTGLVYNLGDLPNHWSIVNSFLYGENFPPEHPIYSGSHLRYYFLSDFFTALLMKSGLSLWGAFTFQGIVLSIVLLGIIYLFTYRFTQSKIAAAISPFLFFFNGGLGFIQFFKDLISDRGNLVNFFSYLKDYTNIGDLGYRWINTTTSLLVPQRPFLFGFPMSILVLTMLWVGIKRQSKGHFVLAGVIAGALPLFHAHSYFSLGVISAVLFLLFPSVRWLWFFIPAGVLSLPQALYLMPRGESAGHFLTIHLGWVADEENILLFYLKNTGLFIPILLGTLILSKKLSYSQKKFAIPFLVIFLIANLIQLAPWDWDNLKVLIYFYIGSIPFVTYGLASIWKSTYKFIPILLGLTLVFPGIISVARTTTQFYLENNNEEIELAEIIKKTTEPKSRFLTAPAYNHFILLTGKRMLHGYTGTLWAQGIDFNKRLEDLRKMYRGDRGAKNLLNQYGVDYVVIGPPEIREKMEPNLEFYINNFPILVQSENYYVFKIR